MGNPNLNALKKLSSEKPQIRIVGARELGNAHAIECISDLVRIIEKEDEESEVKQEAIVSIGKIGEIEAGKSLISTLKSNDIPLVMESISTLGILGAKGFIEARKPLEDLLEHPNYRVRKFTIEALGKCGSEDTIDKLYTHFQKPDISVETKQLIATAIGNIGGAKSIKLLKNLVFPNDEVTELQMEVRRAIIFALGEAKTPQALDVLGRVYNNSKEPKIIRKYTQSAIHKTILGAKEEYMSIKKRAEDILKGKN
ncbi:MAG: HEAT repeat domain-containing protein [Promethearchaeota archaeon]